MERMVERYLSLTHPVRRYEFMSQIKVGREEGREGGREGGRGEEEAVS